MKLGRETRQYTTLFKRPACIIVSMLVLFCSRNSQKKITPTNILYTVLDPPQMHAVNPTHLYFIWMITLWELFCKKNFFISLWMDFMLIRNCFMEVLISSLQDRKDLKIFEDTWAATEKSSCECWRAVSYNVYDKYKYTIDCR